MLRGVRAKRLVWILAAALTASLWAGGSVAADVNITASTATGVNLDGFVGATAEVGAGVSVSNVFGSRAVNATVAAWAVTNRGAVSSSGPGYGINLDIAGSSVTNFGTVTAAGSNGVVLLHGGSVDNKLGATISASNNGISIGAFAGPGAGSVTNAGTITQTGIVGDLVLLAFGGTVTNLSTGIITANNGNAAVSIGQGASRTVINSGLITNTSTSNNATGVIVQGGASTITNNLGGQISGYLNGIWASGSTNPLTLTNAGTITSSRINGSAYAVEADGGGTITNTGTITSAGSSGVFMGGTSTLTNSGTITGPTNAITFSGNTTTHTLKLDTGSVLNGNVVGVTNAGATDNLVLLGTGTESAAKFLNFETLSMQGSAWTLTGNTAFATSGTVQAGVLTVGGNLTSPLFSILSGGTLTGTGTIISSGGVGNGGTIRVAAGDTLSITGALTQGSSSTFAVGVTPTIAGVLSISGAANLGGSALSVLAGAGTFAPHASYTILTAASVSGNFGTLTSSSPFLTPSIVYNPASVVLTLDRSLVSFASAGSTRNQIATGTALDTLPPANPVVVSVATLSLTDAARAFDQLSGEAYASAQAALANDSRYPREAALDRVDAAFAAIDALKAGHRSIWGQGFGGMSSIAGDGNAAPLGGGTGGLLFGTDGVLDDMPVSLFGGFSASHFGLAGRGSEVAMQSFHFGASAGREMAGVRVKGGAIGSLAGITVNREVRFAGFSDSTAASYAEATGQLFAELSYAIAADTATLEPFGRLVLVGVSGGNYAETGGSAALSGRSDGYGLALATLGLAASTDFALADDLTVHARGRIGLQQGFGGAPTATNQFAGSDSFTIAGTPAGGTTLLFDAELSASLTPATTLSVGYSGAVGSSGGSGALKATLSGEF